MKCPACGHWNKPSFPRCFRCGEPLSQKGAPVPAWQEKLSKPPAKKVHIIYDDSIPEEADIQPIQAAQNADEPLAAEMSRLKERRERGSAYLSEFRKNASEKGIAPSGAGISIQRSTGFFQEVPDNPDETLYAPVQTRRRVASGAPRPVARRSKPKSRRHDPDAYRVRDVYYEPISDIDIPPSYDEVLPLAPSRKKRGRARRSAQRGPVWLAIWAVRMLIAGVLLFGLWTGYTFLMAQSNLRESTEYAAAEVTMTPITIDGYPGQRVLIAGEEGAQYYISELTRSYVVVGGVATIDVPDHVFYDTIENIDAPQMDVSLTPTLRIGAREERIAAIHYTIDIPLSPITLVSPETTYLEVSTSIYNMQLQVAPGSRVIINGENISDSVNENGIVTFNPPVHAIGENIIRISVVATYHRENNMTITLYRPPQDVPLELLADTALTTSKGEVEIFAATSPKSATAPGATITIETPHKNLNVFQVEDNGNFSFTAVMSKVGYNAVRIRASLPGKEDSVLEHNIYYLPTADVYTPKAWALTAADYSELLNNIALRVKNAQIYECKGEIVEILSEKPQLAIMNTGVDGKEQLVMLQNESTKTWEKGKSYRVYADVSGIYDKMPRFSARYTYSIEQ